ncbi:hypothetical protein [Runella sp.]|uniref:hypothetical protein n=1 Tax=Runella sp. TaxID=1960881 RepID=UPI003D12F6EB
MVILKKIGIWMDSETAHLMEFTDESLQTVTVESKKDTTLSNSENLMHNKEQQHQSEYYKKLSDAIREYEDVLLFGPTNAKAELFNLLKADHHFDKIKIEMLPADKMTENQQYAFVREYFSKN